MLKKQLLLVFIFFTTLHCFSQKITGTIFSINTKKPIENVAIITNLKTGTTSNKFGVFNIETYNVQTITFSCLGYKRETISIALFKKQNYKIYLTAIFNQLEEIELKVGKISLDSLLIKTKDSMRKNYISGATKQEFYAVEKQELKFNTLELDLKSSSLLSRENRKLAQKEFEVFSTELQNQNPKFSKEFVGEISSKKIVNEKANKTFYINKIDTITGYKNNAFGKEININNIQDKVQNVILKYLKNTETYKVKSGLFKVEDSLSFKNAIRKSDSINKDNSFGEFKGNSFKFKIENAGKFFENEDYKNFLNTKYYKQNLEKTEYLGTIKYYVVSFKPRKSKAKFSGRIYINPNDFSIKKVTYNFAKGKRGDHLNLKWLLGVKFSEDINSGTFFYEKNEEGKIYTSYFKESFKNYGYVNRPIKFIENSKNKEKVKFNIKIDLFMNETNEILIKNRISVSGDSITGYKKENFKKTKKYISEQEYLTTNWKNNKLNYAYLKKYE